MSPDQLPSLYDRVDRLEASIERLQAKPETARRLQRIEQKQQRLAMTQGRIDTILRDAELKAELEQEANDALLARDSFEITYSAADDLFSIEVTDSPFDRTYDGGDPLLFRFVATQATAKGSRTRGTTGTLANGNYWEGNETQTLITGGDGGFDNVTAYVLKDNGDGLPLVVTDADILAIEHDVLA